MICPACGHDNLPGSDRCDDCMQALAKLDVPQSTHGLQQGLMEDPVSVLNPAAAVSVSAEATVTEAVQMMKTHKVGCLLALEGERLVGVLSERDLLFKCANSGRPLGQVRVKEVMTGHPVTLSLEDPIRFALHEMSVGGFRHIPIVRGNRSIGIISIKDVLSYLSRALLEKRVDKASAQGTKQ